MILVTGATGSIGTRVVHYLEQGRVPFTAFVRDRAKGTALGCDFAVGDFDDPRSLTAAMRNVDTLLLNAGGAVPATGVQPMVAQQRAVIDAAVAAEVTHVVKISVLGAKEGGRLAEGAHWEIEEYLKMSGLDWTVLRPSGFMQNFVTGAGMLTADGTLRGPFGHSRVTYIDCDDIAACAAVLLGEPGPSGRTFDLTGPEALSQPELAACLSAAVGRRVAYEEITPKAMTAGLVGQGLPADFARDVVELWTEVSNGTLATTTTAVEELIGRKPRTFGEFLAENRDLLRQVVPTKGSGRATP